MNPHPNERTDILTALTEINQRLITIENNTYGLRQEITGFNESESAGIKECPKPSICIAVLIESVFPRLRKIEENLADCRKRVAGVEAPSWSPPLQQAQQQSSQSNQFVAGLNRA